MIDTVKYSKYTSESNQKMCLIRDTISSRLFFSLILILFLFTPQFRFPLGPAIKAYWFVVLGFSFLELLTSGVKRCYFPFLISLGVATIYSVIIVLLSGIYDTFVIGQVVSSFLMLFSASYIVRLYIKVFPDDWEAKIYNGLASAIFVNSAIILLSVISLDFREIFYSVLSVTEKADRYLFGEVHTNRFPGLTVSGFSYLSLLTALVIVSLLIRAQSKQSVGKENHIKWYIVASVASATALIFVARTGLYISLAALFAYVFLVLLKSVREGRYLFVVEIFLITFIASFGVSYIVGDYYEFAFELFLNYLDGGGLSTTSTDSLIDNEFFFPEGIEFLFGNGNFGRGDHYIESDIGWVLFVSGAGVVGVAFLYCPLLYLAVSGYVHRMPLQYSRSMLVCVLLLLASNFKDIYYLSHGYLQPIVLLYVMGWFSKFQREGLASLRK